MLIEKLNVYALGKNLSDDTRDVLERVVSEYWLIAERVHTLESVWRYIAYLKQKRGAVDVDGKRKFSQRTIIKNLALLRGFFRYMADLKLVTENYFDRAEFKFDQRKIVAKRETQAIPFEHVKKLINAAKDSIRDRAILSTFFATGIRVSELRFLTLGDIKELNSHTYLHVRRAKGGKPRFQTLPGWAVEPLFTLRAKRKFEGASKNDPLFTGYRRGNIITGKYLCRGRILKLFKRYVSEAGLEDIYSPHSARATAITKLLADGCTYRQVQDFSGHQSIEMVQLYDKRRLTIENHAGIKLVY